MTLLTEVCTILVIISAGLYFALILFQVVGLLSNRPLKYRKRAGSSPISIVVPFRNEIENLRSLQKNLSSIVFKFPLEIIWVDDHSEDDGAASLLENKSAQERIVTSDGEGKKQAIHTGINLASHDVIVTIDADVTVGKNWLTEIQDYFAYESHGFLIMPVLTHKESGIWGYFEGLDVLSLTGTTIAWANHSKPILCNGANLAFRKTLYNQHRQLASDLHIASGDDLFFLHQIKKHAKQNIGCRSNTDIAAHVSTFNNFKSLVNQRVRWVSKSVVYRDFSTILVSIVVLGMYFSVIATGILMMFNSELIKLFLIIFCGKFIIDFLFLFLCGLKFKKSKLLIGYPISWLLQFIFVPLVFFKSRISSFEWKNRVLTK